jgi:hypothetical protein
MFVKDPRSSPVRKGVSAKGVSPHGATAGERGFNLSRGFSPTPEKSFW